MDKVKTAPAEVLERVGKALNEQSEFAWRIQNLLAFMVQALPDDEIDALPVKCALINAATDMYKLAETLMDVVSGAKNG